ncbi:carbonic anhydrase [Aneurinibacillus sp. Ricciae_BoGa-3]|uniref:beta-class carbonic anhydrase n=1 Tax=Aneurinibacillus sp. Ricciae_BoGa-3 TaxID=3022697 RepID=UPI0023413C12|nr:carbonic anhydrase [Aneurinibacillus sp. Ricciae_BoGa-3]WCK52805.1 carbonic anhydrase [Aneurinibacillus sp. Ricciae_BoGa-3]
MSILSEILEFNKGFVEQKSYEAFQTTKFPAKKIVILGCMDTRLTELLPHALNIRNGDAKLIKNAGALVSHPFGSIMRSIIVAIYSLGAKEVFVVGHHDCGMTGLNSADILNEAGERGISDDKISTLKHAGINLDEWLTGFSCVEESVAKSVEQIKSHPLLPADIPVHGLVIHPETGKLDLVVNGYQKEQNAL